MPLTEAVDKALDLLQISKIPKKMPFSLQLRFVSRTTLEKMRTERGFFASEMNIEWINDTIARLRPRLRRYIVNIYLVLLDNTSDHYYIPAIVAFSGPRETRRSTLYRLYKVGISSGWIPQRIFKEYIDTAVEKASKAVHARSELMSMVYRVVSYTGMRRLTVGGTANFWPKGISELKEAIEKYIAPVYCLGEHYVLISSLRYKLTTPIIDLGTYSITRRGLITIESHPRPSVSRAFSLTLATELFPLILSNYKAKQVGYRIVEERYARLTLYGITDSKNLFLNAIDPGKDFYENAKLIALNPQIHNPNLIAVPIEIGNPRTEVYIMDKKTGEIATITVSYKGIMISSIIGDKDLSPGFLDQIQRLFEGLYRED